MLQNPNIISAQNYPQQQLQQQQQQQQQQETTSVNRESNISIYRIRNMKHQRPIIDLLIALVAIPLMILCALQLEKNLQDIESGTQNRWLVFGLGISLLVISVIICGYITHRMGVCLWSGPIDRFGNPFHSDNVLHINSQNDVLRIVDAMPPSYDSVMNFDVAPPPYECLIFTIDEKDAGNDNPNSIIPIITSNISMSSSATATTTTTTNTTTAAPTANVVNNDANTDKVLPAEMSVIHI